VRWGQQYDADGNREQLTYPDGTFFTFDYDHLGRQTAVYENGGTIVTTISYDARDACPICIDLDQYPLKSAN
jgi:YD repeat-containing protein